MNEVEARMNLLKNNKKYKRLFKDYKDNLYNKARNDIDNKVNEFGKKELVSHKKDAKYYAPLKRYNNRKFNNKKIDLKTYFEKNIDIEIEDEVFLFNDFSDCDFERIKFINCIFDKCIFSEIHLSNSNSFKHTFFSCCILNGIKINKSNFYNSKIIDMQIYDNRNIDINDVFFNEHTFVSFNDLSQNFDDTVDKKDQNEIRRMEFEFKANAYKKISEIYLKNNQPKLFGEYFYFSKVTELKKYKLLSLNRIKFKLAQLTCGFGERPFYSLLFSLGIVTLFTILYMLCGLRIDNVDIKYYIDFNNWVSFDHLTKAFLTFFHFSLVTFTTVGYGNIVPIGYSVILSGIEMIIGVIMVGLWVSTIVRKMTR